MAGEVRQCTATSKQSGERCRRRVREGATVCAFHGGKIPAVVAATERRAVLAEVTRRIEREVAERPPMTLADVYSELMQTAQIVVGWRDIMQERLQVLEQMRYTAVGAGTEQIRGEIVLFERALDRSSTVLGQIAKLDLEARAQALSARQGDLVAEAIHRILDALNLSPEQQALVPTVVPRELRRIGER